jgi:hypothetical protein
MERTVMVLCLSIMIFSALPSIVLNASAIPIAGSSIGRGKAASGSLFAGVNLNDSMRFDFSFDPVPPANRKTSKSLGLQKNVDGAFSVHITSGAFTQVFDDRIPAKLVLRPSPSLDEYKSVANEGNLLPVWRLRGDGLTISDSLDQIPDLTRLTGADGSIREKDPSGETPSKLRFRISRPSVGIQYAEPAATRTPQPAIMILLGSGFLVLFGFARKKLRKS